MNKQKSHAFHKDTYLLGKHKNGSVLWLEAASWDYEWYWGFGYVEEYTNPMYPNKAKDIRMHTHFNQLIWRKNNSSYLHHINEVLQDSVLTKKESWELSDLMKSFYTLQEAAELFYRGGSHLSNEGIRNFLKSEEQYNLINKQLLPNLFEEVYKILSP